MKVEVVKIHKNYEAYVWEVSYQATGSKEQDLKIVQGNFVFLSAGPLGSTKLLMQSRTQEFDFSPKLGTKFCGNGGLFGKNWSIFFGKQK